MTDPEEAPLKPEGPRPDDHEWRGNDGSHRRVALGCTGVVVLVLLAFWIARTMLMR
jgi:hypothetical protein